MIHTIDPGYFCVPSAIQAITGADMQSVILPALNRASDAPWLLEEVVGVHIPEVLVVLRELGYRALLFKNKKALGDVGSWAERYLDRVILLFTHEHCVVVHNALAFDNHTPMGKLAISHPFTKIQVTSAYWITK